MMKRGVLMQYYRYMMIVAMAFTFSLNAQEENYTIQTEGNVTNITNNADVVAYTSKKNDQQFINSLKAKYNGLSDTKKLDELLKNQNYIEVLNYLWSEPDHNKRLQWLESKANEGHPILMFELGEEYYIHNPNVQTFVLQTMPWLMAGTRRTLIDASCTSDQSVGAAPEYLLVTYRERILGDLLKKHNRQELQTYIEKNGAQFQKSNFEILKKVLTPLVDGDASKLPSPAWVYPHGLAAFTGTENSIPSSECAEIRKNEAQEFLDQIKEIEEQGTPKE